METTTKARLNTSFLRKRVGSAAVAAKKLKVRPATLSNLYTGKTPLGRVHFDIILGLADIAQCGVDDLLVRESPEDEEETFAESIRRWSASAHGTEVFVGGELEVARSEEEQLALLRRLPRTVIDEPAPPQRDPNTL